MPKIEPFEQYTSRYNNWFIKHRSAYRAELRAIQAQLPECISSVEIGVGSGRFAAPLGIKLGIEPSRKMRERARKRGVEVIAGIAEALPFPHSSFELVLMVTVICFVDDIEQALNEAYRVLKPDGYLVIGFVDRDTPVGRVYEQKKEESVFYKIARFYTTEDVVQYLKKAHFKNFSFFQTIFHNLSEITDIEPVKQGYGTGSFVVVKAQK
jgi:ubiquinone/menaquinone biosynthesis C-methylase UbiE